MLVFVLLLPLAQCSRLAATKYFYDFPRSITVASSASAYFFCSTPRANQITWAAKGDHGRRKVVHRSSSAFVHSTYELKYVDLSDDGKLVRCNIRSHVYGELGFAAGRLNVLDKDKLPPGFPTITEDSGILKMRNGLAAVLRCSITADPPVEIRWLKNGLLLDSAVDVHVSSTTESFGHMALGILRIFPPKPEDTADYQCMATNSLGTTASEQINVVVRPSNLTPYPVQIYSYVESIQKRCREKACLVRLTCIVLGNRAAHVYWKQKRGSNVYRTAPEVYRSQIVVPKESIGAYTCVTDSPLGEFAVFQQTLLDWNGWSLV